MREIGGPPGAPRRFSHHPMASGISDRGRHRPRTPYAIGLQADDEASCDAAPTTCLPDQQEVALHGSRQRARHLDTDRGGSGRGFVRWERRLNTEAPKI